MLLGSDFEFTVETTSLIPSVQFYEDLGFRRVAATRPPHPTVTVSDGRIRVSLTLQESSSCWLTYFPPLLDPLLEELASEGLSPYSQSEHEGRVSRATFGDPGGFTVALVETSRAKSFPQGDIETPIGTFRALEIPAPQLESSLAFWRQLGFADSDGESMSLTDGLLTIHLNPAASTPSLLYSRGQLPLLR